MRLLHISDTHGKHRLLNDLPQADVIVHTGDITENGSEEEVRDFIEWFGSLSYEHKLFIAGNHDVCLYGANIEGLPDNLLYLCNNGIVLNGIKFYGVPMFPQDSLDGELSELYYRIPDDTDILLTHQPPLGILDESDGVNYGDYYLYKSILRVMPSCHLFGHVHDTEEKQCTHRGIRFSNAAGSLCGQFALLDIEC